MQKLWGRKISDLAFAEFMNILDGVALSKGKVVHKVNRFMHLQSFVVNVIIRMMICLCLIDMAVP